MPIRKDSSTQKHFIARHSLCQCLRANVPKRFCPFLPSKGGSEAVLLTSGHLGLSPKRQWHRCNCGGTLGEWSRPKWVIKQFCKHHKHLSVWEKKNGDQTNMHDQQSYEQAWQTSGLYKFVLEKKQNSNCRIRRHKTTAVTEISGFRFTALQTTTFKKCLSINHMFTSVPQLPHLILVSQVVRNQFCILEMGWNGRWKLFSHFRSEWIAECEIHIATEDHIIWHLFRS